MFLWKIKFWNGELLKIQILKIRNGITSNVFKKFLKISKYFQLNLDHPHWLQLLNTFNWNCSWRVQNSILEYCLMNCQLMMENFNNKNPETLLSKLDIWKFSNDKLKKNLYTLLLSEVSMWKLIIVLENLAGRNP